MFLKMTFTTTRMGRGEEKNAQQGRMRSKRMKKEHQRMYNEIIVRQKRGNTREKMTQKKKEQRQLNNEKKPLH